MLFNLYKSNLFLILLFVFSILIDNVNGYFQNLGFHLPIGILFRTFVMFMLIPSIKYIKKKNFIIYFIVLTFLYLLSLFYWIINYEINLYLELQGYIRIVYAYVITFYFITFAFSTYVLKYVRIGAFISSLLIIFCFITGLGFKSYGETYGFGTKAFFIAGNDLGLTMLLSLLLSLTSLFKEFSLKNLLINILITISLFLIGSRVGILGSILVWSWLLLYYIFFYHPHKRQNILIKRFVVFIIIPVFIILIYSFLEHIYNNVFDSYTQDRLSRNSIFSARDNLINSSITHINGFNNFDVLVGHGSSELYSNTADKLRLYSDSKSIEADFYEIIGSYGFLLGFLIYFPYVYFCLLSLKQWIKKRNFATASLVVFFILFISIGYLAGHAINNVLVAPVYAYAISILINKINYLKQ